MEREQKLVLSGVIGVIVLLLTFGSYTIVRPGQRGVLVTLGKTSENVYQEGFHLKLPLFQTVHKISIQVQKSEAASEAATKDLQRVTAKIALNWNLNPEKVNDLYKTIGDEEDIYEKIIVPAVSETLKAASAKMTAEEVLTKRMELKENIDHILTTRLNTYNINVRDISIVDLDFTKEFNHAVEEKQIAEQEAKKAEYVAQKATAQAKAAVNLARGNAEAELIKAKAEAEANSLKQKTLTRELIEYEKVQKWNGVTPTVVGGGNTSFLIDVRDNKHTGE